MTVVTHDELEQLGDAAKEDLGDEDLELDDELDDDGEDEENEAGNDEDEGGVEDEGDETSLDRLIAQRDARRRRAGDADDDEDLVALVSEGSDVPVAEPLPERIEPIEAQVEFVCRRCFLVKRRSQLADAHRMLCRDCV